MLIERELRLIGYLHHVFRGAEIHAFAADTRYAGRLERLLRVGTEPRRVDEEVRVRRTIVEMPKAETAIRTRITLPAFTKAALRAGSEAVRDCFSSAAGGTSSAFCSSTASAS